MQQTSKKIISVSNPQGNSNSGLPRDLEIENNSQSPVNVSSGSGGSYSDQIIRPAPPIIVGIKSQTAKPGDGGKFTIDVVIEIQDAPSVASYDIRIAKNAGYL